MFCLEFAVSFMALTDSGQKGFFLQVVNQAETTELQLDFSVCSCSFRELVVDCPLFLALSGHFITGSSYAMVTYVCVS